MAHCKLTNDNICFSVLELSLASLQDKLAKRLTFSNKLIWFDIQEFIEEMIMGDTSFAVGVLKQLCKIQGFSILLGWAIIILVVFTH